METATKIALENDHCYWNTQFQMFCWW